MQDFLCLAIAGVRMRYARIMLNSDVTISFIKLSLLSLLSFVTLACTHQSNVLPSQGHIDAKLSLPTIHQQSPAPIIKETTDNPVLDLTDITSAQTQAPSNRHTYSVVVNEVPVKEVLYALIRDTKMNADISPLIQGLVTMSAIVCMNRIHLINNAAAVVFSLGVTGGQASGGVDERQNLTAPLNTTFISHPITTVASTNGEFDHIVTWLSPYMLYNAMIVAGQLH